MPIDVLSCIIIVVLVSFIQIVLSDISSDISQYYEGIDLSATDLTLKTSLKARINPHTVLSYDDIWTAFDTVYRNLANYPCNSNNSTFIPDIYSAYCWDPEKLSTGGECGNYAKEGDCFNREHLWPKSWFGGFDNGANAQTDLFELWPSDGYVNGLRANYPFGYVGASNIKYTSTSGCKIGTCDVSGYSGTCFEPPQSLKGDFARSYFYLSVAYMDEWSCCDDEGVDKSTIKTWMENVLREWHEIDPVDSFEDNRNQVIFKQYQGNRNPFIDYPQLVHQISDF